jgi:hypothetical protein
VNWNLAVPNSDEELDLLTKLTNCEYGTYWIGIQYEAISTDAFGTNGIVTTVDGSEPVLRWDAHYNFKKPAPNNVPGRVILTDDLFD